ncbi:hypothetical protein EVAR_78019_1 [Eumeta japonica]|uniref:Uncharacterized protein n=1 Tax=Eumeta variegata TaxID=151549 RepID=A0A4C1T131_EUMVA|nr:hypothetical protein EVAR_78019_1 [Eumeta japonica]
MHFYVFLVISAAVLLSVHCVDPNYVLSQLHQKEYGGKSQDPVNRQILPSRFLQNYDRGVESDESPRDGSNKFIDPDFIAGGNEAGPFDDALEYSSVVKDREPATGDSDSA